MSKYIDAEKLIERLEEMKQAEYENCGGVNSKTGVLQEVQELIISHQQEQPETTSIKGYLNRDIGGQLIISLSPNYMDDEWMLLESKLFPNIKSGDVPRCVNITIKEI